MQPNWDLIAPRTWSYPRIVVHSHHHMRDREQPKEPLEGFHTKVLYVLPSIGNMRRTQKTNGQCAAARSSNEAITLVFKLYGALAPPADDKLLMRVAYRKAAGVLDAAGVKRAG